MLAHFAIVRVNTGQVDFADESDVGRRVGVFGTAVDLERVDAVLVHALCEGLGQRVWVLR